MISCYFIIFSNTTFIIKKYRIPNIKDNIEEKLFYLSSLDNPNVTFFSDLKLTSIENLNQYNKIDKDIILLKKSSI